MTNCNCMDMGAVWCAVQAMEVPRRWEVHGNLVMLPETAFCSPSWQAVPALWAHVAEALSVKRVAKKVFACVRACVRAFVRVGAQVGQCTTTVLRVTQTVSCAALR